MRKVTREEADNWKKLAEDHGFINESGGISIGRFIVETLLDKKIILRLITPLIAPLYTHYGNNLKSPPILFDRTSKGEIIIPGRWWADMLDGLSEHTEISLPLWDKALFASKAIKVPDALLPPSSDTISFIAPDDKGQQITFEALPPNSKIVLNIIEKED